MSLSAAILDHRANFPALHDHPQRLYFNYGGQGVLAEATINAVHQGLRDHEAMGGYSQKAGVWTTRLMQDAKKAVADLAGVAPNTISLTENTTVGCNIALWSVPWQQGDHLLLTDCEHPAVWHIAHQIAARFGVSVTSFPLSQFKDTNASDPQGVQSLCTALVEYLQPTTRALMISHGCWNTGQLVPLRAISDLCHQSRPTAHYPYVYVLVDAAQSAGMIPLDQPGQTLGDLDVDVYGFTGHKWLCGPTGTGAVYVKPSIREELQPVFVGWRGLDAKDGGRFEVATSSYPLLNGFKAAIDFAAQWGNAQQRYERLRDLSQQLWTALQERNYLECVRRNPPETGLISFKLSPSIVPQDDQETANYLKIAKALELEHQMYLRAVPEMPCLRLCVHYLTTTTEIEQWLQILDSSFAAVQAG
ncbi:MAG: aminotransferase class V-fold PLP-dependent enzyme [Pseudanabaenaceae cyanobacterium]